MADPAPTGTGAAAGEHPAAAAWRALGHEAPVEIETMHGKPGSRRCVYRLRGADDGGGAVIAKRYRAAEHEVERRLYREVLPHLAAGTPRYFGEVEAGDGNVWIFLEDVGSGRFAPADAGQRRLAARWLAALHASTADLPATARLPDRGPRHYRAHLETGRRLILDNLDNPALRADDATLLLSVLGLFEDVERRWGELEAICAAAPVTLVHGDFRPKNVYVRDDGTGGRRLLVIDWETAGRGAPAADLAPQRHTGLPQVDLESYCRAVGKRWPDFDPALARNLMWAGLIFRRLAAVDWAAVSLVYPRADVLEDVVARMRVYHGELGVALRDAPRRAPA